MSDFFDQLEIRGVEERESALLDALRSQLVNAKNNTTAYAEILEDYNGAELESLAALAAYPVTRKSALIEKQKTNPPFGGLTAFDHSQVAYIFSSPGPIYEASTKRPDYWRFARALYAAGLRSGEIVHNCFSYHLTPAGSLADSGCHALGCAVIPAGVGQTELQIQAIQDLKPGCYVRRWFREKRYRRL